jgi:hypothetical protein
MIALGMDSGQLIYIICRLVLGAAAAFLAILLWAKTRDLAWMLMVIGAFASYGEVVYSILELFGMSGAIVLGTVPKSAVSILFSCLPLVFFIAAFAVMVARNYRRR